MRLIVGALTATIWMDAYIYTVYRYCTVPLYVVYVT